MGGGRVSAFQGPPAKMTIKNSIVHFWGIELQKTDRQLPLAELLINIIIKYNIY